MWLRKWREKQKQIRDSLKDTHAHRIVGDKIFHSTLWKGDKRSVSGGLFLGLFVALTPTIPFQMLIVTFGAIYWKVNLPIALAACWITNPFTVIPIYGAAMKLGSSIVHMFGFLSDIFIMYNVEAKYARFIQQTIYLWIGSLVISLVTATSASLAIRMFWNAIYRFVHTKRSRKKAGRSEKKPGGGTKNKKGV